MLHSTAVLASLLTGFAFASEDSIAKHHYLQRIADEEEWIESENDHCQIMQKPINTDDKNTPYFRLGVEEASYLYFWMDPCESWRLRQTSTLFTEALKYLAFQTGKLDFSRKYEFFFIHQKLENPLKMIKQQWHSSFQQGCLVYQNQMCIPFNYPSSAVDDNNHGITVEITGVTHTTQDLNDPVLCPCVSSDHSWILNVAGFDDKTENKEWEVYDVESDEDSGLCQRTPQILGCFSSMKFVSENQIIAVDSDSAKFTLFKYSHSKKQWMSRVIENSSCDASEYSYVISAGFLALDNDDHNDHHSSLWPTLTALNRDFGVSHMINLNFDSLLLEVNL